MNIGLIGFGYWGKNIYRNLYNSDSIKKIFIFDIDKKNFKENKKASFYINSDKFFNERDIDSFIIATPTSTHLKYIKKCLNLQKKVCITKPITKTYSELLDLKRNFNNCCNIFLDHTYLYHPTINFIKNLLLKKKLGKLIYYDSERINFGKFYKDVDVVEDLAVHDVYILDYLLNGKLPNKIITTSHKNFGNKKFLSNITLKYKNGFFANIKVSWFSPLKSRRILLAGKNKMLEFDDNEIDKKLKIYDKGVLWNKNKMINQWEYRSGQIKIPHIKNKESLMIMIEEFIKFTKSKKKDISQFNQALRVMKVLGKIKK